MKHECDMKHCQSCPLAVHNDAHTRIAHQDSPRNPQLPMINCCPIHQLSPFHRCDCKPLVKLRNPIIRSSEQAIDQRHELFLKACCSDADMFLKACCSDGDRSSYQPASWSTSLFMSVPWRAHSFTYLKHVGCPSHRSCIHSSSIT